MKKYFGGWIGYILVLVEGIMYPRIFPPKFPPTKYPVTSSRVFLKGKRRVKEDDVINGCHNTLSKLRELNRYEGVT